MVLPCHRFIVVATGTILMARTAAQVQKVNTDASISLSVKISAVDCGGHFAENCAVCPQANGELWCNGECMWYNGSCEEPTFWAHFMKFTHWTLYMWGCSLPFTFLTAIVMTAYAVVYKKKIVDELPQEGISVNDDRDFEDWKEREVGLFECFSFPNQCLWATFCTPVVSAKNYSLGQVGSFWPSCCLVFVGIFSLFWPVYCIMAIVRTVLSSKLQRNLEIKPNFCLTFVQTLFCFPCEVGRESIEVNNALGVDLSCPFEIDWSLSARVEVLEEAVERSCRICS